MKRLLQLSALGVLVIGLATSCIDTLFPDKELAAPTDLTALNVTETSADLSWAGVAGADFYNLNLNDGTMLIAGSNYYHVENLTPNTEYSWAVQAVKGDVASPWSTRSTFFTGSQILPLDVPANLTVTDLTFESAILRWDAVAEAIGYEVMLGDTPFSVETPMFAATALAPLTQYTWTVRALAADRTSEWAPPATFTTLEEPDNNVYIEFSGIWDGDYYGDYYENGTDNFYFMMVTFDPDGTDYSGWVLQADLLAPPTDHTNQPYYNIPEGTYDFNNTMSPFTIYTEMSFIRETLSDGYYVQPYPVILEGTLTIEGDAEWYDITLRAVLADGRIINGESHGPWLLTNPNYNPYPDDLELEDFTVISQFEYYMDPWAEGCDIWLITTGNEDIYVNRELGRFMGSGWFNYMQLHTPLTNGGRIPEGVYPIDYSYAQPSVLAGDQYYGDGLSLVRMDNDVSNVVYFLESGTVTITDEGEAYNLLVESVNQFGQNVTYNIHGSEMDIVTVGRRVRGINNAWIPYATKQKTEKSTTTNKTTHSLHF
jgi:hypothetical protein